MKKIASLCLAAMMLVGALTACGNNTAATPNSGTTGKVVVNIEGTVTAVNGSEITLGSGKIVVITSDTVFAGDPDTNNAISEAIVVGNFIQGYTADDPDAEKVSAGKIYCNSAVRTGGKLVINFEGTVAAVEGDRITLENGQEILISDDTVFSIASGVVENVILSEGHTIQGYAEDGASASRVHIITH